MSLFVAVNVTHCHLAAENIPAQHNSKKPHNDIVPRQLLRRHSKSPAASHNFATNPRHSQFARRNPDIASNIEAKCPDHCHTGEVNLVDTYWEPMPEDLAALEDYVDEGLEAIDGCTQEDVGWMKIARHCGGMLRLLG